MRVTLCQEAQKDMNIETFANLLNSFSHREARFDSRTEPLFRLFDFLAVGLEVLRRLASAGDDQDRTWARRLLHRLGGPGGYDRLVSAAVVADGMMVIGKVINRSQAVASAQLETFVYDSVVLSGMRVCARACLCLCVCALVRLYVHV